jgi:hypothetical protein
MTDVPLPHRVHSGEVLTHHPADRYGCTICHQGQGAATNFYDAKAEDAFWDYPLLPAELTQATCTSCHDLEYLAGKVPEQVTLLRAGRKLFSDRSCGSCQKLGGRGGTLGRALDSEGSDQAPIRPDQSRAAAHHLALARRICSTRQESFRAAR